MTEIEIVLRIGGPIEGLACYRHCMNHIESLGGYALTYGTLETLLWCTPSRSGKSHDYYVKLVSDILETTTKEELDELVRQIDQESPPGDPDI